jgi:hypothetical protein
MHQNLERLVVFDQPLPCVTSRGQKDTVHVVYQSAADEAPEGY